MRMPLMAVAAIVLAGAVVSQGQVASSPVQLLHPIMKDPNHRNAPTSVNQDPNEARSLGQNPRPAAAAPRPAAVATATPAAIVAKVDAGLAASRISVMGTLDGIKGTIYVTNVGAQEITPMVQLAVCDPKGFKIGTASKTGSALAPNAAEKIVILATNLTATDFKLMQLTRAGTK
jgi:hypothetical protein